MKFFRCSMSHACRVASLQSAIILVGLATSGFVPVSAQQSSSQKQRPYGEKRLPLDPLTRDDKAMAEKLARSNKRVRELLGEGQVRLILVQLVALKPESYSESARPVRHAEVVLFRPEGEVGVQALVNLENGAVEQVRRMNGSEVPMNSDDLAEAFQLALRDEEVLKILGSRAKSYQIQTTSEAGTVAPAENSVTGLRVRSSDEHDPCSKHRCLQLAFRQGTDFLSTPMIIADLTAKRVYVERKQQ